MQEFTPSTLPSAVRKLFELNHYSVEGPIQINGAEIDLVARQLADPFGAAIYIEVTVENVDNSKYGNDLTKLSMVDQIEPFARKLIVSSSGFTAPVVERAKAANIDTFTYSDLFKKFERFEPYISLSLGDTQLAIELSRLSGIYEEPDFADTHGSEKATSFLTGWKNSPSNVGKWLLITGEYGTGKTALTKVLQYRWLKEYQTDPNLALPLRIELRDFPSQFNAKGLLHHFLDHNDLSHLSVEFVFTLIRSGRAILILDGYDEMAQYLHARERRACLEALAELSDGGAKGIITSRPNYFTEAEELQIYEILYKSLEYGQYSLGAEARNLLEKERRIDQLLEQFIDRYERILKDLSPQQTEKLINRVLSNDPDGRQVILNLLGRIFRRSEHEGEVSLSGKPVIVSYLLDVVEGLKDAISDSKDNQESLTEWQVYKLIIDQLMLRDLNRSPEIAPHRRREFLRKVAILLSKREKPVLSEDDFRDVVSKEFQTEIRRLSPESHAESLEKLFADLRSSATLTRGGQTMHYGWRFSHNTLREYLVAEALVSGLEENRVVTDTVTISDAMKLFASSTAVSKREELRDKLARAWQNTGLFHGRGQLFTLLWEGMIRLYVKSEKPRQLCLNEVTGKPSQMAEVVLNQTELSNETDPVSLLGADFSKSNLSHVGFCAADLTSSNFTDSMLENVDFRHTILKDAKFSGALIVDSVFTGSDVEDADFTMVDQDGISILVENQSHNTLLTGFDALGYLHAKGAKTNELRPFFVLQHHPAFWMVDKILKNLAKQSTRQRRGLEQRGAAQKDVKLAIDFVDYLQQKGFLVIPKARKDLVKVTDRGRRVFSKYVADKDFDDELILFFGQTDPS